MRGTAAPLRPPPSLPEDAESELQSPPEARQVFSLPLLVVSQGLSTFGNLTPTGNGGDRNEIGKGGLLCGGCSQQLQAINLAFVTLELSSSRHQAAPYVLPWLCVWVRNCHS